MAIAIELLFKMCLPSRYTDDVVPMKMDYLIVPCILSSSNWFADIPDLDLDFDNLDCSSDCPCMMMIDVDAAAIADTVGILACSFSPVHRHST